MNTIQEHWYNQVRSDFEVYKLLQNNPNIPVCHSLHYLQMLTEKLSKAFITRQEQSIVKTHKGYKMTCEKA